MKSLVVSIHDVSPLTHAATVKILRALKELGVARTSLLVVPNHHHRAPILAAPEFCTWLRGAVHEGHEAILHGYYHQRARRAEESLGSKFTTRFYTADEGEFYDLGETEARALVLKAREEFAQPNLHPAGFIAPAWLLSAAAERVLRELDFDYTTRLGSVSDLKTGAIHRSQSLVWSVRAGWRRAMSLGWNRFLFYKLRANPLMRLSIHPPDFSHPKIRAQICTLIRGALAHRAAIPYHEWVAGTRDVSAHEQG